MMSTLKYLCFFMLVFLLSPVLTAQETLQEREDQYYKIITLPVPEDILLEVGGLAALPDGRIAVCTRRGDIWVVENPGMYAGRPPQYIRFAEGLHEPLGLAYQDNALYAVQRGELTRLRDTNGDGIADRYETVYDWPLSGHYHEYSYGPKFMPDGSMMVTANVAFGDEEWWRGESPVPWRGWTMRITENGQMEPWATGMRSPCGLGVYDGEFFYDDNQGDWMGSGAIWHVEKGSFTGHPAGLRWSEEAASPVGLQQEAFFAKVDRRREQENGRYIKPSNIPGEANPGLLFEVKKDFPEVQVPAVWLPHGVLGISNSEILEDQTEGRFGPFGGQLFVGDQGQSKIMRVVLEKVKGQYQGVAFDFRSGFQSGVLRMDWGIDGSLFVGETNRGWGSAGTKNSGLERLVWTGLTPFEMKTVRAMPDGFEIEFTMPVDPESAKDLDAYAGQSFIYKYHPVYGSPTIKKEPLDIEGVLLAEDGKTVRLQVTNMRAHFIHQLNVPGIRAAKDTSLKVLHPSAYYTLNAIPEGTALADDAWIRYSSAAERAKREAKALAAAQARRAKAARKAASSTAAVPTYAEIEPLLIRNTCTACHNPDTRQVGPAYREIAKRGYTPERIVELIYNPEPENWPDYTPMAPMPQVPKAEALRIARWINSLK